MYREPQEASYQDVSSHPDVRLAPGSAAVVMTGTRLSRIRGIVADQESTEEVQESVAERIVWSSEKISTFFEILDDSIQAR